MAYWLRPVPVSVTVEAGEPGTRAVVSLVAVMVGATAEACRRPRPPVNVATSPLPALGAGLVTMTSQVPGSSCLHEGHRE